MKTLHHITEDQYVAANAADPLAAKQRYFSNYRSRKRAKLTEEELLFDWYFNESRFYDEQTKFLLKMEAESLRAGIDPRTGVKTGMNLLYVKLKH